MQATNILKRHKRFLERLMVSREEKIIECRVKDTFWEPLFFKNSSICCGILLSRKPAIRRLSHAFLIFIGILASNSNKNDKSVWEWEYCRFS